MFFLFQELMPKSYERVRDTQNTCQRCVKTVFEVPFIAEVPIWQPLGPLLKVKVLVRVTCKIP